MALFKEGALPVVCGDIAKMLRLGAENSATATRLLMFALSAGADYLLLQPLIQGYAQTLFSREHSAFLSSHAADLNANVETLESESKIASQMFHRQICSLLPQVTILRKIDGRYSWATDEYEALLEACLLELDADGADAVRLADAALRLEKKSQALEDTVVADLANEIVLSAQSHVRIRPFDLRDLVIRLIKRFPEALNTEIQRYYCGARTVGMFAWDKRPLASHLQASYDAKRRESDPR